MAAAIQMWYLSAGREVLQATATALAATPLLILLWLRGRHSPQGTQPARLAKVAIILQVSHYGIFSLNCPKLSLSSFL